MPEEIDLDLDSMWDERTTHRFIGVVRWEKDLSRSKFYLEWDASKPKRSLKTRQEHFPPPGRLSVADLNNAHLRYGGRIAGWSSDRLGEQVGNGECWTLARDALKAIAAEDLQAGKEPVMVTEGRVHGYCFATYVGPRDSWRLSGTEIKAGDIVEFENVKFVTEVRDQQKGFLGEVRLGLPVHTAVVTGTKMGAVEVLEQNLGDVKRVQKGGYDLKDLVSGKVTFYRPVGASWVPPLSID